MCWCAVKQSINQSTDVDWDISPVARCRSYFGDRGRRREPKARGSNQVTWSYPWQSVDFCCSCYSCVTTTYGSIYHICALWHICHLLTHDVANTLTYSIVGACIYYCNSILHGALTSSITKLQRLQNSLALVVLQQPRRADAEPLLRSFHRLPVEHRVTYKLQAGRSNIQRATPAYFNSLISNRVTVFRISLGSSTCSLMAVPMANTVCASRSFSMCIIPLPVVWNSLLPDIKLCSCLKTFK